MEKNQENELLIDVLKKLDFFSTDSSIENDFPEIVFTKNPPSNLHPKHYLALEFAELYGADAVFFRYYDDNRYCVPQIYFYDNNLTLRNSNQIAEIHRKVYSSCQVPMLCFIDEANISMFDCRIPVSETKTGEISNSKSLFKKEKLTDLEDLSSYFSAKHLNYGLFWETEEASKSFLNNQSAYEKLVQVLSEIRNDFISVFVNDGISINFADDLLFKCILIKYLEENGKDENSNTNFAQDFYKRNNIGFDNLKEILINGKIIDLFESLENHFNGGVFNVFENGEKELLRKLDLTPLAEHLDGNLGKNKQLALWKIYSFKDIPIELISNFYEEFIPKIEENKGTVYTPSFLVNLLIDECLPLSNRKEDKNFNVKLIDVSCGSGIFITSAYKRLVQRWRISKGENGKPLSKEKIKLKDVKSILSKNIYGVDKNATAVKLTKFSLQLALCQIVPNNELWNWSEEKVFDKLNNNIFERDFFKFIVENEKFHNYFDLVIGNPPFKKLKDYELQNIDNDFTKSKIKLEKKINSKKQLALTFLEVIMYLSKKETGRICQIIPSGELLYFKDSYNFRNYFLKLYNVSQILDFTLLRRNLFASKKNDTTVPVLAIFAENKKPTNEDILHITLRRTKKSKEKIYFELDYYDFFNVNKQVSLKNIYPWKSNLFGGQRVLGLVKKFYSKNKKNLKDYLNENDVFIGNSKSEKTIKIKKTVLNGCFPILQTFDSEAIILRSKSEKKLFNFYNNYLLDEEIKKINNFFISVTSGRQGLRGAYTIIDSDFYNLPYIQDTSEFSFAEKIIIDDVCKFQISEFGLGEEAPINKIIEGESVLKEFADIFNQSFNSIYKKDNAEQKLRKIIIGKAFYALEFHYSNQNYITEIISSDLEIDNILKKYSSNSVINRIVKIYGNNTITLVKPKTLRYWLKSIALRDADDVFEDMIKTGY